MENEENEDLLLQITESEAEISSEKEESDYYVEKKILDFIQNEEKQSHKSYRKKLTFLVVCLLMFLSSSFVIITFPIYIVTSKQAGIGTYAKLITISLLTAICLVVVYTWSLLLNLIHSRSAFSYRSCCLPNVLKVSLVYSMGSTTIFWLQDGGLVPCHLEDPLKGCEVVFSLLFYFVLCRKKMSLERIFCVITVIVGVFVTVDFGLCDKYHCYGMSHSHEDEHSTKSHLHWVLVYIIVHGLWVLPFTLIERSLSEPLKEYNRMGTEELGEKISTSSMLSIISNIRNTSCEQSLSSVFPYNNSSNSKVKPSLKITTDSYSTAQTFPRTSTPKLEELSSTSSYAKWDNIPLVILLQQLVLLMVVVSLFWTQTVNIFEYRGTEADEILNQVYDSIECHTGISSAYNCNNLQIVTVILLISYITMIYCCMKVLSLTNSAVTIISMLMLSLPMSGVWWSLYSINTNSVDVMEFSPAVTGEAISALIGFPIIGIGVLLLIKSHIKGFNLQL